MALLEYTLVGEYDAIAGSHHLNHLLKKFYEDESNYEIIDLEEASEQAVVFEMAYQKLIIKVKIDRILVITISNPLLIGIYENKNLLKSIKLDGKTSDLLPKLFENFLKSMK